MATKSGYRAVPRSYADHLLSLPPRASDGPRPAYRWGRVRGVSPGLKTSKYTQRRLHQSAGRAASRHAWWTLGSGSFGPFWISATTKWQMIPVQDPCRPGTPSLEDVSRSSADRGRSRDRVCLLGRCCAEAHWRAGRMLRGEGGITWKIAGTWCGMDGYKTAQRLNWWQ